jgi:hypothetical protein
MYPSVHCTPGSLIADDVNIDSYQRIDSLEQISHTFCAGAVMREHAGGDDFWLGNTD